MKTYVRSGLAVASVLLLVPAAARGQDVEVTVRGRVTDRTGAVLAGAAVTARQRETERVRTAAADAEGRYVLQSLPPGTYDLRVERTGFAAAVRRGWALHVGASHELDVVLEVGGPDETVEVTAPAGDESGRSALGRLVPRREIDGLPVVGRDFNELAALAPGVTRTGAYGGVEISGSRDFQNGYFLDGVSSEGVRLGTQRLRYSQDWIEEFEVVTAQAPVEFGQASGGIVHVITRSGGNTRGGRLYGFLRDDAFDARPRFVDREPPLDQWRFGATLGGPLRKDRVFYFVGLERYVNRSSGVVASSFPSANGVFPFDERDTLFLGKLDFQAAPGHRAVLRVNGERRRRLNAGVGGRSTEEHGQRASERGDDVVGLWNAVLSSQALNQLRLAYLTTRSDEVCNLSTRAAPGSLAERAYPGALFGCPSTWGTIVEDQAHFSDEISWTRGAHAFKAGAQTLWLRPQADVRNFRDGVYAFNRDLSFRLDDPATYPFRFQVLEGPTTVDRQSVWAAGFFVQDRWRVARRLTLGLGLRYDLDRTFTAFNRRIRRDRGFQPIRVDTNNVAPRLGFAWAPFDDQGRTLVRGGLGVFYDQSHSNLVGLMLVQNIQVDRGLLIDANVPFLNPFWPDASRARRFLAEALAAGEVPDRARLPTIPVPAASVDPGIRTPGTVQASLGLGRDLRRRLRGELDVVLSRGFDQIVLRDVNRDPVTYRSINAAYAQILSFGNGGWFSYKSLRLQVGFVPSSEDMVKLAYTLASARGNVVSTLSASPATNPFAYSEDEGPSNNDIRHVLVLNGAKVLPGRVVVSGIVSFHSALPFSVSTSRSLDADPFPDRPEPRNSRRGDDFFSLDLRLARPVRLGGRRTASVFVEGFNLTNNANFTNYVGALESTRFGQPTGADPNRRVQLGLRLDF